LTVLNPCQPYGISLPRGRQHIFCSRQQSSLSFVLLHNGPHLLNTLQAAQEKACILLTTGSILESLFPQRSSLFEYVCSVKRRLAFQCFSLFLCFFLLTCISILGCHVVVESTVNFARAYLTIGWYDVMLYVAWKTRSRLSF